MMVRTNKQEDPTMKKISGNNDDHFETIVIVLHSQALGLLPFRNNCSLMTQSQSSKRMDGCSTNVTSSNTLNTAEYYQ
jgi:hypothetical protein